MLFEKGSSIKSKQWLVQAKIAINQLLSKSEIDRDGIDALEVKNRTKFLQYSWGLFNDKIQYGNMKKEAVDPIHYKNVQKCRQFLFATQFKWDPRCPKTLDVQKLLETQQTRT